VWPSYGATSQAVPSAQLLPDGFSTFGDYEIPSVLEEDDEDVVKIRKRASEDDCSESDRLEYSGWRENGNVGDRFEDETVNDIPDPDTEQRRRGLLEARAKEGVSACKDMMFDGSPAPGIPIYSPEWPSPDKLEVCTPKKFSHSEV
jgi:hypothetical protein